jgi:hypothetical protein
MSPAREEDDMRAVVARTFLAGLLALSAVGVACDESDRPEPEDVERGVEEGGEEVEQQSKRAARKAAKVTGAEMLDQAWISSLSRIRT